jgi:uncharacterized membrane protein YvlD (DUF360 family)
MKFNFKNIYKAGLSTFTGLFSGTCVTLATALAENHFDVKGLYAGIAVAVAMAFSDMFKECKKEIDEQK